MIGLSIGFSCKYKKIWSIFNVAVYLEIPKDEKMLIYLEYLFCSQTLSSQNSWFGKWWSEGQRLSLCTNSWFKKRSQLPNEQAAKSGESYVFGKINKWRDLLSLENWLVTEVHDIDAKVCRPFVVLIHHVLCIKRYSSCHSFLLKFMSAFTRSLLHVSPLQLLLKILLCIRKTVLCIHDYLSEKKKFSH